MTSPADERLEQYHAAPWPVYDDATVERCAGLLRAGRNYDYKHGPEIAGFERAYAERLGRRYALTVNSGSSALFLAFLALGVQPGDEVVVPTWTFTATATALFWLKATPCLADAGDRWGNVTAETLARAIGPRTRGIAVTHLFGQPADMKPIRELADARGLFIVEDCSHAHGSTAGGRPVGTVGDASVFSVGGRKMVSGGMGGLLVTDRTEVHDIACLAAAPRQRSRLTVVEEALRDASDVGLGGNLRMSPIAAVLAHSHLSRLDALIRRREALAERFVTGLEELPGVTRVPNRPGTSPGARHAIHVELDPEWLPLRDEIVTALQGRGLKVGGAHTTPLHRLQLFRSSRSTDRLAPWLPPLSPPPPMPNTDALARAWLSLPGDYLYGQAEPFVDLYLQTIREVWSQFDR